MTGAYAEIVDVRLVQDATGSVVAVSGDVIWETASMMSSIAIGAISPASTALIVDLSQVTFMDSSGLGALLTVRDAALAAGVDLCLRSPSRKVTELLRITGLADIFPAQSL